MQLASFRASATWSPDLLRIVPTSVHVLERYMLEREVSCSAQHLSLLLVKHAVLNYSRTPVIMLVVFMQISREIYPLLIPEPNIHPHLTFTYPSLSPLLRNRPQ